MSCTKRRHSPMPGFAICLFELHMRASLPPPRDTSHVHYLFCKVRFFETTWLSLHHTLSFTVFKRYVLRLALHSRAEETQDLSSGRHMLCLTPSSVVS